MIDRAHQLTLDFSFCDPPASKQSEDVTIRRALDILQRRAENSIEPDFLTGNDVAMDYAQLQLGGRKQEVFGTMFLTNKHQLIAFRELFYGTVSGASVYPREVVRAALDTNAAAVVFAHNHPCGDPTPSSNDVRLTERLVAAMGLVDVRVLDHIVVAEGGAYSFAQEIGIPMC